MCVKVSADDPVAVRLLIVMAVVIVLVLVPLFEVKKMLSPVAGPVGHVATQVVPPLVSDQLVEVFQLAAPAPGIQ